MCYTQDCSDGGDGASVVPEALAVLDTHDGLAVLAVLDAPDGYAVLDAPDGLAALAVLDGHY